MSFGGGRGEIGVRHARMVTEEAVSSGVRQARAKDRKSNGSVTSSSFLALR